MNLSTILIYFISSIFLFAIIQYFVNNTNNKNINQIITSLIFIIIISGLLPNYKNSVFFIICFEFLIRFFYINYIDEQSILNSDKPYIKIYLIEFIISYIINTYFINQVDSIFPDPNELKNIIWLIILISIYFILKDNLKLEMKKINHKSLLDNKEYIVMNFAKFKNKYNEIVQNENKDINTLIYSIMIYNNYKKPIFFRKIDFMKFKINNSRRKLGIMQLESNKLINDEESIELSSKKIDKLYTKILNNKNIKKDKIILSLVDEYIKDKEACNSIIQIYNILVEFNKN